MDIRFQEAECVKIDSENKKVYCRTNNGFHLDGKEEFVVDYDYLVISIGARSNTFNIPGVEENCHFLKVLSACSLCFLELYRSFFFFLISNFTVLTAT